MLATIKQNKIGHLHVWFGDVNIIEISKSNYLSADKNNKESDLYLQTTEDIQSFLDDLDSDLAKEVLEGYTVKADILDDYDNR
ncbi:MAG: hypothetical protein RL316_1391 [Bacteroidota bacterium]